MKKRFLKYGLELFGDACIIAFGVWSIFTFYKILTCGGIVYIEPNVWIARWEFFLACLVVLLGFRLAYKDIVRLFKK